MTNFEKIKNMSISDFCKLLGKNTDKEIVIALLFSWCDCGDCPAIKEIGECNRCTTTLSKWLESEVQE